MRRGVPARQGKRTATFVAIVRSAGMLEIPVRDNHGRRRYRGGISMLNRLFRVVGVLAALLLLAAPAQAQSPSPGSLAAAKELLNTINFPDQFKALMPIMLKNLKPAIVQGRADVDRDYEAMMPGLLDAFQSRIGELSDAAAAIYASNFSADELRTVIAFYKTPAGQKFLQKQPIILQQTMAAGQQFGQSVAADMKKRVIEELRKKGHTL
jgi:hypothetical protein